MKNNKTNINVLRPWGNYQEIRSCMHTVIDSKLPPSLKENDYVVYANGRSYGDCILNKNTVETSNLNAIVSFNDEKGIIRCQSGVLFSELLKIIIPKKWFLPVTPGTKYITVGGAIAADVHGKNHHKSGCFSDFVLSLQLLLPDGSIVQCSNSEHEALFRATCGGMGLTGVILEATFQLMPVAGTLVKQETVSTSNLKAAFKAFETYKEATYLVAWIDSTSQQLGKGIVLIGEHTKTGNFNYNPASKRISIPRWFPSVILNPLSIKIYNWYYYLKQKGQTKNVSIDAFFYPLDGIKHWNRLYGKKGFVQYQVVIPKKEGYQCILQLLETVKKSKHTSYLTILKLMRKSNKNFLSFPLEGYTIAMDFKVKQGLWPFLNNLDAIVSKYKGRAYLAKDGRMEKAFFESGYPELENFKAVRKQYNLEQIQSLQSKRLGL